MLEKKINVDNKDVRSIFVKKRNKRKFSEEEEVIKSLSRSSPHVPFSPLQISVQGNVPNINSNNPHSKKRKKYQSLPISYARLLPILVQSYKVPIIPTKLRNPPYQKWYDPSSICECHEEVERHSIESCTAFNDKVQALIDANLVKFQELISGYQG